MEVYMTLEYFKEKISQKRNLKPHEWALLYSMIDDPLMNIYDQKVAPLKRRGTNESNS